jgi:hypothetical protein
MPDEDNFQAHNDIPALSELKECPVMLQNCSQLAYPAVPGQRLCLFALWRQLQLDVDEPIPVHLLLLLLRELHVTRKEALLKIYTKNIAEMLKNSGSSYVQLKRLKLQRL